jgi:hypothetical protein
MRQALLDLSKGHIETQCEPFYEALNEITRRYPLKGKQEHGNSQR